MTIANLWLVVHPREGVFYEMSDIFLMTFLATVDPEKIIHDGQDVDRFQDAEWSPGAQAERFLVFGSIAVFTILVSVFMLNILVTILGERYTSVRRRVVGIYMKRRATYICCQHAKREGRKAILSCFGSAGRG